MIDLDKLGKMVDEALANETKESLTKWLKDRRFVVEESMNKHDNSQYEIKQGLVNRLMQCMEEISKHQEEHGIPVEGLTIYVADIGVDEKKWDLTLALTPKGILENFIIHEHRKGRHPLGYISN